LINLVFKKHEIGQSIWKSKIPHKNNCVFSVWIKVVYLPGCDFNHEGLHVLEFVVTVRETLRMNDVLLFGYDNAVSV
jgi:hypothetical protein